MFWLVEKIVEGVGSIIYVGVIFVVLVYGYISTFGREMGGERIGSIVDSVFDKGRLFAILVFIAGCVVGWKETMFLGAWSVVLWFVKSIVMC